MHCRTIIAALIAMIAGAANVHASMVNFMGIGFRSTIDFNHDGSNMTTTAGEILIDFKNAHLKAYCVDIDHAIVNTWDANAAPITEVNGGKAIAFLYDTFHGSIISNIQAAALQIAIWETLDDYGGVLDLDSGNFQLLTAGDIRTTAQGYLNTLPVDLTHYQTTSYLVKSGDYPRSQNLIVPEPATMVSLALMAPVFFVKLRSKRMINARAA